MSDPTPLTWADPARAEAFQQWLSDVGGRHAIRPSTVRFAAADADFRRYLRVDAEVGTRIIMDAPPEKIRCEQYVQVAQLVRDAGLKAPQVLEWDATLGFMLLTDLGEQTLMQHFEATGSYPEKQLIEATRLLVQWQTASRPDVLPPYDRALLMREMQLFPDWYLGRHKSLALDSSQLQALQQLMEQVAQDNLRSPQVFVHRDYMTRNLMVPHQADPDPRLGILDFQDAVYGPITYDIASLLRDAFVSWEEDAVLDICIRYWQHARAQGLPVGEDFGDFYRAVEWMGLQRHLKVAGIFARLTIRDGKPKYLADTPRFIGYIRHTCARYRELRPLLRWIDQWEGTSAEELLVIGR